MSPLGTSTRPTNTYSVEADTRTATELRLGVPIPEVTWSIRHEDFRTLNTVVKTWSEHAVVQEQQQHKPIAERKRAKRPKTRVEADHRRQSDTATVQTLTHRRRRIFSADFDRL
jgi:hypothetical protein